MKQHNHFFEFEDLVWFPDLIRNGMTNYLRFLFNITSVYQPAVKLLSDALQKTNSGSIIDLCSGGGGPLEQISRSGIKKNISIALTDKFPNIEAFEQLSKKTNGHIAYIDSPVDAACVPTHLKGFRTIFSSFHHFDTRYAKSVLEDAVRSGSGIAVFDGGDKNIFIVLLILIIHPLAFFFCTPFFQPFKLSLIVFTYLIPIIPLCTIWDGIISITRLYSPGKLLEIAMQVNNETYTWRSGKIKNKLGISMTYLIGYPS